MKTDTKLIGNSDKQFSAGGKIGIKILHTNDTE